MKRILSVCIGLLLIAAFAYADTADRAPAAGAQMKDNVPAGPDYSTTYRPFVKKSGGKVWHLQEGFEGSWLPAGWDSARVSGTYANYLSQVTSGTYPTCTPHSGTYMVKWYCFLASAGNRMRLMTPPVGISSAIDSLSFWMTHSTGYSTANDRIVVEKMVKSGGTWGSWVLVDSFSRYQPAFSWAYKALPLGMHNGDSVRISLTCHSMYGDNIYLDDVSIGSAYTPTEGDLELYSIDAPAGPYMTPDEAFTPQATVSNPGTTPVSNYRVVFDIDDGTTKALVYTDTVDVAGPLDPGNAYQASFDGFTPQGLSNYYVTAYVSASGDPYAENDTIHAYFRTFNELQGNVADDNAGGAGLAGATITAAGPATYVTTTDGSGDYFFFDMTAGTYTVTASKAGYINETMTGISVVDGAQTTLDLSMGYPVLSLSPADSIYCTLPWGEADSTTWQFTLENTGTRDMSYSVIWPEVVKGGKALGDSLWGFTSSHIAAVGVEVAAGYVWVTSGGVTGSGDGNYFLRYDFSGNFVDSLAQGTTSTWGYRDMAFDGTYLYAADENTAGLRQVNVTTGAWTGTTITVPGGLALARGVAYNPDLDRFYAANWASNIVEFNRSGAQTNIWTNAKSIYGLAYDGTNPAGPSLWAWSQDSAGPGNPPSQASRFDLTTGTYGTETWQSHSGLAGGATITDQVVPGFLTLLGFIQDTPDRGVAYELRALSCDWLNISPSSGTVGPFNSHALNVTFDAAGLDSFTNYAANVTFNTNAQLGKAIAYVPAYLHVVGTGVSGGPGQPLSYAFGLNANRPNPVRGRTSFSFTLPRAQDYSLKVYNVSGQLVESFAGKGQAGANSVNWNAQKAGAGVYLYRLSSGGQSATRKLVIIK